MDERNTALPDQVHERARELLGAGNAAGARALLEPLMAGTPRVTHCLTLSAALRALREPLA